MVMFGAVAAMALVAALHEDQTTTDAAAVGCEAVSKATDKSDFALVAAVDAKEEIEKVRLAQILHDLHALANENQQRKSWLRRVLTLVGLCGGSKTKEQQHAETIDDDGDGDSSSHNKPLIGDVISLQGVDLAHLSKDDSNHIIEAIASGSKLDVSSLQSLVKTATALLKEEPNLINLSSTTEPISVIGDLHGSLSSLTHILHRIQLEDRVVIFDGDFVDRGDYSLEVLLTLLVLKVTYPKNVYLLRGNHEDTMIASAYGFQDEIRRKYGDQATSRSWDSIGDLFGALPLAALSKFAFICAMGGFQTHLLTSNALKRSQRKFAFQ